MMHSINWQAVLQAYALGLFPMAKSASEDTVYWVDPDWRGVIPLDEFHVPRSLKKLMRKEPYKITINKDFRSTILACAQATDTRDDTWINQHIADVYTELHERGHAHSVEAWEDDILVGGLYGVAMGGAFFGESMFTRRSHASKICLVHLVQHMKQRGFVLLDTQFLNDHLQQFGATEIARHAFHAKLQDALDVKAVFDNISIHP